AAAQMGRRCACAAGDDTYWGHSRRRDLYRRELSMAGWPRRPRLLDRPGLRCIRSASISSVRHRPRHQSNACLRNADDRDLGCLPTGSGWNMLGFGNNLNLMLSLLATAVVALAFEPAR